MHGREPSFGSFETHPRAGARPGGHPAAPPDVGARSRVETTPITAESAGSARSRN